MNLNYMEVTDLKSLLLYIRKKRPEMLYLHEKLWTKIFREMEEWGRKKYYPGWINYINKELEKKGETNFLVMGIPIIEKKGEKNDKKNSCIRTS